MKTRIVYNKLLGGWYVVRGPHQTPLAGRFETKEAAKAYLARHATVVAGTKAMAYARKPGA